MPIRTFQEAARMSVIPEAGQWTRTSFTLPTELLEKLEVLREQVNAEREKPDRFSRDRFLQVGLEWFERELREERRRGGRSK